MPTRAELFWQQSEHLIARWQRLLQTDPDRVRGEAARYLRWLRRLDANDEETGLVRDVLSEIVIELMIEAVLSRQR